MNIKVLSVLAAIAATLAFLYFVLHTVYRWHVVDPDKRPALFLLLGIVAAFLLVRVNARVVRAGVKWWPGNIERGDVHVHHALIGVLGMVTFGIAGFAMDPTHPWLELIAFCFGGSVGLALDEFALFLHVEDCYWTDEGRKSIDAVIMSMAVTGLVIVGAMPMGLSQDARALAGPRWVLVVIATANALILVVTFLKGRLWLGVLGVLVPPFAWWGAARLAQPDSPWARRWYRGRPELLEKARHRDETYHRRLDQRKHRLWDLIGGAHGRAAR